MQAKSLGIKKKTTTLLGDYSQLPSGPNIRSSLKSELEFSIQKTEAMNPDWETNVRKGTNTKKQVKYRAKCQPSAPLKRKAP